MSLMFPALPSRFFTTSAAWVAPIKKYFTVTPRRAEFGLENITEIQAKQDIAYLIAQEPL